MPLQLYFGGPSTIKPNAARNTMDARNAVQQLANFKYVCNKLNIPRAVARGNGSSNTRGVSYGIKVTSRRNISFELR